MATMAMTFSALPLSPFSVITLIIMFTIIIQFFIFKKETGMYPVSSS